MAQYFADQMANMINDPNVVYPRNALYEKYMSDLESRCDNLDSQIYTLRQDSSNQFNHIDSKVESILNDLMLKNTLYSSIFKHFPKIGHLDHMNDNTVFTMIVHEESGEDFCVENVLDKIFYKHIDGSAEAVSHVRMFMKKDEYERFMFFIAQKEVASFGTWCCYEFTRSINRENANANIVDNKLAKVYELYRMLPEDGIQYDDRLIFDQNMETKKSKYYPKTYDTDELAQMTDSELEKVIRNNINAYEECHNPDHVPYRQMFPVIFVPYHGNAMTKNNRSCMIERFNVNGINPMTLFE